MSATRLLLLSLSAFLFLSFSAPAAELHKDATMQGTTTIPSGATLTVASGGTLNIGSATLTLPASIVVTGGSYADPAWITSLAKSKVSLGNVENTALSTWAGTANVTTLGTVATGTWQAAISKASNLTSNGLVKTSGSDGTLGIATAGTDYAAAGDIDFSGLTMETARLLGRTSASTGPVHEINVGGGLSLASGWLTIGDTELTALAAVTGAADRLSSAVRVLHARTTPVSSTGTTGYRVIHTYTMPAGTMGANSAVDIMAVFSCTAAGDGGSKYLQIEFGGAVLNTQIVTGTRRYVVTRRVWNRGAAASNVSYFGDTGGSFQDIGGGGLNEPNVDTAAAVNITAAVATSHAGDVVNLEGLWVTLIP